MRITRFTRFAALTTLLVLSTACSPRAATGTQPSPAVPPTATPEPTNTPPAGGLCSNALWPVKTGATWTYTNSDQASNSESFTTTITNVRPDGFTVSTPFSNSAAISQEWACKPEGLVALSLGAGESGLGLSLAGVQANLKTSNPTGVTIPANVQAGSKWTYGLDIAGSISQGTLSADVNGTVASDLQAMGMESVTVPAGTFNAMKIQSTSTFKVVADYHGLSLPLTSVVNTTFWFAPGVGMVKSTEDGELAGSSLSASTELQSFNIP